MLKCENQGFRRKGRNTLFLLCLIIVSTVFQGSVAKFPENYWTQNCLDVNALQSPINIKAPFTYIKFKSEFQFNSLTETFLTHDGNILKMEADFGNFIYNGKIFNIYELNFKSPSEHTIGKEKIHFPLELQISTISVDQVPAIISILFSASEEENEFLSYLGFGTGILQHLQKDQYVQVKPGINLANIIPQDDKFFIYHGTGTNPPCSSAIWLISYQTFKISQSQIDDFPRSLTYKIRETQPQEREIFVTFYPSETEDSSSEQVPDSNNNQSGKQEEQEKVTFKDTQNVPLISKGDSFNIPLDNTKYENDFFPGGEGVQSKLIKTGDYIVVTKREFVAPPKEETKVVITEKTIDQLINEISENENSKSPFKGNTETKLVQMKKGNATAQKAQISEDLGKESKSKLKELASQLSIPENELEENINEVLSEEMKKNDLNDPNFKRGMALEVPKKAKQRIVSLLQMKMKERKNNKSILDGATKSEQSQSNQSIASNSKPALKVQSNLPVFAQTNSKGIEIIKITSTDDEGQVDKDLFYLPGDSSSNLSDRRSKEKTNTPRFDENELLSNDENELHESSNSKNINKQLDEYLDPPKNKLSEHKQYRGMDWGKESDSVKGEVDPKNETVQADTNQSSKCEKDDKKDNVLSEEESEKIYYTTMETKDWPAMCKNGNYQSPIHIDLTQTFWAEPLRLDVNYSTSKNQSVMIRNDGYKLSAKGNFGLLQYGDHMFSASEILIHHPSEHTLGPNKLRTDMEMQIIHTDKNGIKVGVALFLHNYDDKEKSSFLDSLGLKEDALYLDLNHEREVFIGNTTLSEVVSEINSFISYDGSITSPPCSEGVKWFLIRERKQVSKEQLEGFKRVFGVSSNIREVQPLNFRKLKMF